MKANKNNVKMIIYVSDLALYNRGVNERVELDLMKPAEARSKYDDFQKEREEHALFISDTLMTYNLGINELDNIDYILYIADIFFSTWSEEQIKVFSDLVTETAFTWDYAINKVTNYDYALIEIGDCKSDEEAVGRYYAEYLDIPNHIEPFFDYEQYGRHILEENDNVTNDDYVIIVY